MRVVFAGTPDFAVPALRALAVRDEVVAVYTQPDRPSGRGRALTPSPVKLEALQRGIPVLQPQSLRSKLSRDALRALQPDLMVVVAYGLILPPRILDIPLQGCWNLHASLLPRWRGAAPIQRAIEAGDSQTGICLMQMDQGLDTGAVLLSRAIEIGAQETAGALHDRLAELGAQVLADGLGLMRANLRPLPQPQDDALATYAAKLDKAEAMLDWSRPATHLANQVRAFNPWPIAEMVLGGERIRIHAAHAIDAADIDAASVGTAGVVDGSSVVAAGQPFAASREGIDIRCGVGALRITRLQRDGGKAMAVADFVNARRDLATASAPKVQWTFGKA